jgi:hypothetical protein
MGGGGGDDGKANMSMGKRALVDILSGTAGGFAQVVAGHPVSCIRAPASSRSPAPLAARRSPSVALRAVRAD